MSLKSGCSIPLIPQPDRTFEFSIRRRTIIRDKRSYILKEDEYPLTVAELNSYVVTTVKFNLSHPFNPNTWQELTTEDIVMMIQKYIPPRSLHLLAYLYELDFISNFLKPLSMGSYYMEIDKQDKTLRTKLYAAIGRQTSPTSSTFVRKCNVLSMKKLDKLDILIPLAIHPITIEQRNAIWNTVLSDTDHSNKVELITQGIVTRTFHKAFQWNNRLFVPFRRAYAQVSSTLFVYPFVNVEPKDQYISKWGPPTCLLQEPFRWIMTNEPDVQYVESHEVIGFSTTSND